MKRTPFQLARDRAEVAEWYTTGKTQWWIAQTLTLKYYPEHPISQQVIAHDVKMIITEWQKSGLNDIDKAKAGELAKLNRLEQEYWDAWENSKKDRTATTTAQTGGGQGRRS